MQNISDDNLKEIIRTSNSWNEVIEKCDLKCLTRSLQRKIAKLNVDKSHLPKFYSGLYSKIAKNSKEQYIELLSKYDNWDDILQDLKFTSLQCLNNLKKYLDNLGIDYSHIKKQQKLKNFTRYTLEEILIEDSLYDSMPKLKSRLIKELDWKAECSGCHKITFSNDWVKDVPISLEIDHINGNHYDNRIENLRFLCPLCHSYTDNYKGKNMRIAIENKKNKENPEFIIKDILNDIITDVIKLSESKKPNKKPKKPKKKEKLYKCLDCNNNIYHKNSRCIKCNDKNKFITACKERNRPSLEQLLEDVEKLNYTNTAKKYGVCNNTIRKWIEKYQKYNDF